MFVFLAQVGLLAARFALGDGDIRLPALLPSLAEDASFHPNASSQSTPNMLRDVHFSGLDIRQTGCPAGYPVFCEQIGELVRCCQSGNNCCPIRDCCPIDSTCYPNGCCPNNAVTCNKGFCAPAGSVCCGQGVCKLGAECMTSKGGVTTCCDPGQQACDDGNCCPAGSECSADVGFCQKIKVSTLTSTIASTSTSTVTSKTTPTLSSASTPKITTPKLPKTTSTSTISSSTSSCTFTSRQTDFTCTPSATLAAKRNALATDTAQPPELEERDSSSFLQYCNLCGQQLPVMIFPYVPGETEELISSTCNGIGGSDQIILHWGKDGNGSARRRDSGSRGYCARIGQQTNSVYGVPNEGDEFPPASSREGGVGAHLQCIADFQNRLGGHILQSYAAPKHFNLQPNQPFIIRVVPGCSGIKMRDVPALPRDADDLVKRDASSSAPATVHIAAPSPAPTFVQDPRPGAASGSGFYLAGLPNAAPGNYQLLLSLNGTVSDVVITDGDGLEYAVDESPSDSRLYTFSLEVEDDLSIGAYVVQNTTPIALTYTGNATLSAGNVTNSTSSPNAVSGGGSSCSMLMVIGVSLTVTTLFVI